MIDSQSTLMTPKLSGTKITTGKKLEQTTESQITSDINIEIATLASTDPPKATCAGKSIIFDRIN